MSLEVPGGPYRPAQVRNAYVPLFYNTNVTFSIENDLTIHETGLYGTHSGFSSTPGIPMTSPSRKTPRNRPDPSKTMFFEGVPPFSPPLMGGVPPFKGPLWGGDPDDA